jgi:hypothetical protein
LRQDAEFFGDVDLPLLYIAKRLKDALHLEDLLTQHGFDYLVEPDTYRGGLIFQTERIGAFFYVSPEKDGEARSFLQNNGFKPYETH